MTISWGDVEAHGQPEEVYFSRKVRAIVMGGGEYSIICQCITDDTAWLGCSLSK